MQSKKGGGYIIYRAEASRIIEEAKKRTEDMILGD